MNPNSCSCAISEDNKITVHTNWACITPPQMTSEPSQWQETLPAAPASTTVSLRFRRWHVAKSLQKEYVKHICSSRGFLSLLLLLLLSAEVLALSMCQGPDVPLTLDFSHHCWFIPWVCIQGACRLLSPAGKEFSGSLWAWDPDKRNIPGCHKRLNTYFSGFSQQRLQQGDYLRWGLLSSYYYAVFNISSIIAPV